MHARLLRQTWAFKAGFALSALISVIGGFNALADNISRHSLHATLHWAAWAAILTAFAGLGVPNNTERAYAQLLTLRGFSASRQRRMQWLAQASLVGGAFSVPALVICLAALVHTQELSEVTGMLVAGLLLGASGIVFSVALMLLLAISRQLAERRVGTVLLMLVIVPDVLHEALPQIPSLASLYDWLMAASLLPVSL